MKAEMTEVKCHFQTIPINSEHNRAVLALGSRYIPVPSDTVIEPGMDADRICYCGFHSLWGLSSMVEDLPKHCQCIFVGLIVRLGSSFSYFQRLPRRRACQRDGSEIIQDPIPIWPCSRLVFLMSAYEV